MLHFYHCKICGNVVILTVNGGGKLSCCGEFMTLLEANTSDGAGEKHVPVVEVKGNKVLVKVSSVAHPMIPQHYIQFVVLETKIGENTYWHLKNLNPGEAPEAEFVLAEGEKPVGAYEYCNLHGLWLTEL